MSYQEIYRGLNKRASNEQIYKLASLIGMVKKAAEGTEEKVPWEYIGERDKAYNKLPLRTRDMFGSYYNPSNLLVPIPHFSSPARMQRINKRQLPSVRGAQVRGILDSLKDVDHLYKKWDNYKNPKYIGPAQGSNDYNALRKYWLQRGEGNQFNLEHPTEYKQQPAVPKLQKTYPGLTPDVIRNIGNTIVNNRNNKPAYSSQLNQQATV